ncbi:cation diffusion facilitator family transporter [Paracrocinitomix mangrovi]|uniref:cation diffusion facilitator family transporter n=1 Tax=Paracrocinitomix mangrovi TaxID=2862509 RepID=UPI001C8E2CCC|nr:cation diffusion facilitator family transporter [Paracrocinitomix mangrovi]UKN03605.1 cation diffusion facilitator family transporter [Paracrocinitomix mangrovi]
MGHDHHTHHHSVKNIKIAFFVNLAFTVFEIIGGIYVNSIAIISDAIHDLGDSISLGTSWFLEKKSKQQADDEYTFGYARFSLLGALINSVILIAGSVYVISEAIGRIIEPEHSNATGMLIFAIIGVVVNGYAAWKLSKGSSMNEKVVSWHLIEDVLGWTAILIASIILQFKDIPYLDPALSLFITLFILYNVFKRLRETLIIFLQKTPANLNPAVIKHKLQEVDNVHSLHNVHVWSLDGEKHVFTAHIKLKNIDSFEQYLDVKISLKKILEPHHFKHVTLELELDEETCSFN